MRTLGVLLLALTAVACGPESTPVTVADVLADPARYKSAELEFSGEVTDAVGVFSVGVYRFSDGTEEIPVLTTAGVPAVGSKFILRGEAMEGVTVAGERYGTALNELEREYAEEE